MITRSRITQLSATTLILAISILPGQKNAARPAITPKADSATRQYVHPFSVKEAIALHDKSRTVLRVKIDMSQLSPEKGLQQNGSKLTLAFPISIDESLPLELEQFSIFGPNTRFVVAGPNGEREFPAPQVSLFRGQVADQPGSEVYLALRADGGGNGYVRLASGESYAISSLTPTSPEYRAGEMIIASGVDPRFSALPEGIEVCGVSAADNGPALAPSSSAESVLLTNQGAKTAYIAIDVDQPFQDIFAGDAIATASYVTEVFGAISAVYERDTDMRIKIDRVRLWAGPAPYATDDLNNLRDYWLSIGDTAGLNYVHLMSGRRDFSFGGLGFITTACISSAYALSGYLNGAFITPAENFSLNNWDFTVIAHEMGHNSGTLHTHDGFSPTIDDCGNGIPSRGTLMSYCHIYTGYLTNLDLRFHARVQEQIESQIIAGGCVFFDCNDNGIDDATDIAMATSFDLNSNGIPDECEDCNGNDTLDNLDISLGASFDINANGIPDECEADCNGNGVPDKFDVQSAFSDDLNGNNIPDECEPDCNGNSVADFIEIANDPSLDLDRDNVLDTCQDCNDNGRSDWMDLQRQYNIFVCDNGANLVREYHERSGWPVQQYSVVGIFQPYDVLVDPFRVVYVADFSSGAVFKFDPQVGVAATPFIPRVGVMSAASALALEPSADHIFVADQGDNSIEKFVRSTGAHIGEFVSPGSGGLVAPYGMVFGPNGNLFVTSSDNTVLEYDGSTGAFIGQFVSPGSGGLSGPRGLVFLASGNLVVASYNNHRLLEYDGSTGAFVKQFSDNQDLINPWGVEIGPNGNLFVARGGGVPRVLEYAQEGRYHRYYIRNEADMLSPTGLAFMPPSEYDTNADRVIDDDCTAAGCCNVPGDFNNSGSVNISDATAGIAYIFSGGPPPPCLGEGNANGSPGISIGDVTFIIAYIFSGGDAPICNEL